MSRMIRTILMGVVDLDGEEQVCEIIELAESLGATLHLVHSYAPPETSLYTSLDLSARNPKVLDDLNQQVQRRLEERVRSYSDSDRIHCHVRSGPAALAVLDVADAVNPDLIVVGSTRSGIIARTVLGTTAQRVIRNAQVPVLVRERVGRAIRRVLLATDLSELSMSVTDRAVEMTKELVTERHPEWRAVVVVGYDAPLVAPVEPGGIAQAAGRKLKAYVDEMRESLGQTLSGQVRVGEPAREILEEAEHWKADLLIIGTHGRGGALRFMIGSVAESVLRRVACDVLVIPAAAVGSPRPGDEA